MFSRRLVCCGILRFFNILTDLKLSLKTCYYINLVNNGQIIWCIFETAFNIFIGTWVLGDTNVAFIEFRTWYTDEMAWMEGVF